MRYRNHATPGSFDRLPREAVGSFNRPEFDDVISGSYEGFAFELYEATLSRKSGKSEVTHFKGVVLTFEAAAPFPGLLIATQKINMVTLFLQDMFATAMLSTKSRAGLPGSMKIMHSAPTTPRRRCRW